MSFKMSFGTWLKHFKTKPPEGGLKGTVGSLDEEMIELQTQLKELCERCNYKASHFTHASTLFKILNIEPNERIVALWLKDKLLNTYYLYE
jgi:hypothetical protein